VGFRARIVERVRRDIEHKFGPEADVTTKRVRWRLLPPGELSEVRISDYYAGLQRRNQGTRYDADRIVKALSLGPNQRYEEVGGVEGYTVFTFPYTSSTLLECPIVGNAIYVIHKDWERWSRMTKQELMADDSGEVVRIVHRAGWFEKVKQELGTPPASERGLPAPTDAPNTRV
jgi:hypothetical protein